MMHSYRRILAVCDSSIGSDDVLVRAILLARTNGARLTVVKSLIDHPGSPAAVEETRRQLSRIVPWIVQEGVDDVSTEVLVGPTDLEVCRYVLQRRHDLVIASSEVGRRRLGIFRGNPAVGLMRRCPCPVWIVKQGCPTHRPVLAAVDAPTDEATDSLDAQVLAAAAAIADVCDAEIHAVHSWEVPLEESEKLKSDIQDWVRDAILDECEAKHRDSLEAMLAPYRDFRLRIEAHLPRGDPATELPRLASDLDAGLIVMGMDCRVGVFGLVMGGMAGGVLAAAPCGVLAVKSGQFRTPLSTVEVVKEVKAISEMES